ncbi:type II RES/Xre toxin-antitoxin system antitoxin [Jiulongibacter sp. NS-SX5]|uniref:type II RES/Xre toxin-antitoxin system antitoxin n=1 Tax=Jiulongibacter sp. NS-SX5 TaxID=3463854 RepID=UPI004058CB68
MKNEKLKNPENNILEEPIAIYGSAGVFNVINTAREGLSMQRVSALASQLSLSLQELGQILHLSLRTLQRYSAEKILDTDASAKALKLATLKIKGENTFGSTEAFNTWLREANPALNNQTPLQMLDTPYGFDLIEQILGRIEHGIFA